MTALLLLISGCAQHLPPLSIGGLSASGESSGPPRVTDITQRIACELSQIVYSIPYQTKSSGLDTSETDLDQPETSTFTGDANRNGDLRNLTQYAVSSSQNDNENPALNMEGLVSYLTRYHFVASVNLTLEVTDNEGLNPALSFITPFNRMKASGNSFTLGVGGQLSGTQDRRMTLAYPIDLRSLPNEKCLTDLRSVGVRAAQAIGLDSGLSGNLGLADIVADGLVALNDTGSYSFYSATTPGIPATTIFQKVLAMPAPTFKEPPAPKSSMGLTKFEGFISFGPPSQAGASARSVTLNGIMTFGSDEECFGTLTGITLDAGGGTVASPNPVDFFVSGPMAWLPPAQPAPGQSIDASLMTRCDGTTKAFAKGVIDGFYLTNKDQGGYLTLSFYSDGSGNFPNSTAHTAFLTDMLTYGKLPVPKIPAIANSAQFKTLRQTLQNQQNQSVVNQEASLLELPSGSVKSFSLISTNLLGNLSSPVGAPQITASPSPGGTLGQALPAASGAASGTGTSFGSTVDFTVIYGLNGGPTWTLTHFKGPTGSAAPINISRQAIDTLNITFVPACQDAQNIPSQIANFWNSIGPCNAASFGNAAAFAQQFNTTQQIAPAQ